MHSIARQETIWHTERHGLHVSDYVIVARELCLVVFYIATFLSCVCVFQSYGFPVVSASAMRVAWTLHRDLLVDGEWSSYGQREGRDLLQALLAVGSTLQRRAAPLPGHEAHDGRRRRRAAQQARPRPRQQHRRDRSGRRRTWRQRRPTSLDHTDLSLVVSAIQPPAATQRKIAITQKRIGNYWDIGL